MWEPEQGVDPSQQKRGWNTTLDFMFASILFLLWGAIFLMALLGALSSRY